MAYSIDNIVTLRAFNKIATTVGEEILVTFTATNEELIAIRGFYYSEYIPENLSIMTHLVTLDSSPVSYIFETSSAGSVHPNTVVCRWILETPTGFNENNPITPSSTIQIVFSISTKQAGTYNLDEFSWAGYFPFTEGGHGGTFGFSEPSDGEIVEFLASESEPTELTKCFIATAAYGSGSCQDVIILRRFRDKVLLKTKAGNHFVKLYYKYSPPLAEWLEDHNFCCAVLRVFLKPLVCLCSLFI